MQNVSVAQISSLHTHRLFSAFFLSNSTPQNTPHTFRKGFVTLLDLVSVRCFVRVSSAEFIHRSRKCQ